MRKIPVQEAIGHVLCHDITQIIPGKIKDRAFKKGHIIKEEDVSVLLSLGKDHIYVWEKQEGMLHENEGAQMIKEMTMGEGLLAGEVKEGKINFKAKYDGLLKIDVDKLYEFNALGEMMMATIHNNTPVRKGEVVAGTRVIPLVIEKSKMDEAKKILSDGKIIQVIPFQSKKVGVVTTGNEVYHKRIQDAFLPVIKRKVESYGCEVLGQTILPDDPDQIKKAIEDFIKKGCDMVVCTGGMSVDPDDVTPEGIQKTGASIVTYGAPVLPGAMLLVAYQGDLPILGLPGCVMYAKTTVFDLVLPRILAGEKLTHKELAKYGHGGFCAQCDTCRYPHCSFGKGI